MGYYSEPEDVYHPITELVPPARKRILRGMVMYGRRRRNVNIALAFGTGFTLGLILFASRDEICKHEIIFEKTDIPTDDIARGLLFVGVMTAQQYLSTRARAVYNTWGKEVPGRLEFFSSENSTIADLPLVALKGVDDSYPPQKKSFLMLQYMWEKYGDKFEWFLRADDDVYIRPDKLESLLRSIDSKKALYIGQAGRGNQEEFGLLSLEYDENFCMGGPGVIMSRETLSRVAPHVKYCLRNLYTNHEDVELGRCVQKFAGIPCTWSYEMQTIFYHNSSGWAAFTGNLKKREIHRAITMHPVKNYKNLYKIHNYMRVLHIQDENEKIINIYRDIIKMNKLLYTSLEFINKTVTPECNFNAEVFGQPPGLRKSIPKNVSELIIWDFIQRSLYSPFHINPRRRIESSYTEGLNDVIRGVMENLNKFSKQRGRIIDFKEILYGYKRFDPLYGADYIIDMLLVYKKYRGHKMTVPVRRHAYLQQQFSSIHIRELYDGEEVHVNETEEYQETAMGPHVIKEAFENGLMKIGENLPSILFSSKEENSKVRNKLINFIVPLAGRFETFLRFIRVFEQVCLKTEERVSLIVVLFPSEAENTVKRILDTVKGLQKQYSYAKIVAIPVLDNFSRAKALAIGASQVSEPDDLLFFIDVDMVFRSNALQRIRTNTIRGKSVYFPIVFSEFDPFLVYNKTESPNHFNITEKTGYWRQYGFGIGSVYKSDLIKVGGFNTTITGWGKEDVDLYEKFVAAWPNPIVFRAVDPDLIHVFHIVDCDPKLEESQLRMCKATRSDIYGSVQQLTEFFNDNSVKIQRFLNS